MDFKDEKAFYPQAAEDDVGLGQVKSTESARRLSEANHAIEFAELSQLK